MNTVFGNMVFEREGHPNMVSKKQFIMTSITRVWQTPHHNGYLPPIYVPLPYITPPTFTDTPPKHRCCVASPTITTVIYLPNSTCCM